MVFVLDEGSDFNAPLDKLWKLAQSEGQHRHSFQRNLTMTMDGQNPVLHFEAQTPSGGWVKQTLKLTMMPPLGLLLEYLDGDFAGSKAITYYTPKGNKTGVTVVGEWVSKSVPADQLKAMVLKNLEAAYNEDQENLEKI